MSKKKFEGKYVLITGAAQGIGFHTAMQFAKAGANLILADINKEKLEAATEQLSNLSIDVLMYEVNVADKDEVQGMAKDIIEKIGRLDILINNAGVGYHGEMEDMTLSEWKRLIDVNLWGPLYHIYAFLPLMKKQGFGQIVNISSGQSFFRLPTWGAYASVKLALGVISEVLHYELKSYNIRLTTVYPYMVNTGFYNDVKTQGIGARLSMMLLPLYAQKPERVAKIIFRATQRKKRVEMVNILNSFAKYARSIAPVAHFMDTTTNFLLGKRKKKVIREPKTSVQAYLQGITYQMLSFVQRYTGNLGFRIEEIMSGEHEFEPDFGNPGKRAMEFTVRWGPNSFLDWINPMGESFLVNDLSGTVSIEGLCQDAPCSGTLELKYFDEQKIIYTFEFQVDGVLYVFRGEKRDIYPWNLSTSHTCCFGELSRKESGDLISTSVTHFHLNTLPSFLASFQLSRSKS
ncbi:MAG: SDR family oxidoreductase [Saprospiraceae bacterium]|nr:SDR family oxidoreductase [Saprospiraceae bacterium]